MRQAYTKIVAALTVAFLGLPALAAVTAEEAAKLGKELTPMGAERAGNANGTIPEWNPDGLKYPAIPKGQGVYPDPFANEKPIFTINAQNMEKYASKLPESTKVLLKRFPAWAVNVYPSKRHVDFPQSVKDAVAKNATRAKLTSEGVGMDGGRGGIPFPIPQNGHEVMWNTLLQYRGPSQMSYFVSWLTDPNGNRQLSNDLIVYNDSPYYLTPDKDEKMYMRRLTEFVGPPRNAGDMVLDRKTVRPDAEGSPTFVYTQGTKRTRTAPEFTYDAPIMTYGAALFFDELGMFEGKMDKFDFKLIGKKEMFIPYNSFAAVYSPTDKYLGKTHTNPEFERWELHRVWIVEATLKKGERHAQVKKVFYVDEDDWLAHVYEAYDSTGKMSRVGLNFIMPDYHTKSIPHNPLQVFYDLIRGQYLAQAHVSGRKGFPRVDTWADGRLTQEGMSGAGVR